MSINFKCPACGKELSADNDLAGDVLDCPACGSAVNVPELPRVELDPKRRSDERTRELLSALLEQAQKQSLQIESIRRVALFFFWSAVLTACVTLVLWAIGSVL